MFELRFLLVGKLSKGFAMSCTEKTSFSKYLQINRIGLGQGTAEWGGLPYIIWWACASLVVSAAVNSMYTLEYHEYTCVRLKIYLKITHTHRCTAGIHVPQQQRQRQRQSECSYGTFKRIDALEFALIIAEYGIRNTKYVYDALPAILPTFRLRSRCGRCRRRCRRCHWRWRLCVTLARRQHWRWRATQGSADKGASYQVTHGWEKIACESRPEKRNLSSISFALGLSVCATHTAKNLPPSGVPLAHFPYSAWCFCCFQTRVSFDMRGQLPHINHEQLSPSFALI